MSIFTWIVEGATKYGGTSFSGFVPSKEEDLTALSPASTWSSGTLIFIPKQWQAKFEYYYWQKLSNLAQ